MQEIFWLYLITSKTVSHRYCFFFFFYLDLLYLICWTCVYNIDISVDVSLFYFFLLPSAWTERKAPAAHRQRCNYQNFHPFNPAVCLIRSLMLFISVFFFCLLVFSSYHQILQRSGCSEDTNFQLRAWSSLQMTSTSFLLPKTAPSLNVSV